MARKIHNMADSRRNAKGRAYTSIVELIRLRYAVHELDSLTLPRSINPLSGLLTSRFRGRGTDFAEVRVYQPGDDVRSIDWRVTARTQTPHTKMFQEEKERPVLILVDQSASMFFGSKVAFKSVAAAEAAALIAWTTLDRGDRVGGIVFAESHHREIRPRRSKHSVLRLLNEIHDFNHLLSRQKLISEQASPDFDYLAEALRNVRRVAKHGSAIFIVSDFRSFNELARIHLRQLARHNDIVGILTFDPLEKSLPVPDLYSITNGVTQTRINTADRHYRQQYENSYAGYVADIRREFARIRSPLLELSTLEPIGHALSNRFTEQAAQA
jgi:uncharacterized protein (DUF58 family)